MWRENREGAMEVALDELGKEQQLTGMTTMIIDFSQDTVIQFLKNGFSKSPLSKMLAAPWCKIQLQCL